MINNNGTKGLAYGFKGSTANEKNKKRKKKKIL